MDFALLQLLPPTVLVILSLVLEYGTASNSHLLRHHVTTGKNGDKMRISYIRMEKIENKILQVTPIAGYYTRSSMGCQAKCALTSGCIALNLIPENVTFFHCLLLEKDHYKRPELLLDAIGAEYHVIKVRS